MFAVCRQCSRQGRPVRAAAAIAASATRRAGIVPTVIALWIGLTATPTLAGDPCVPAGPTVGVAAVLDDLEIALDDGRVLRLGGIDPARATPGRPGLGREAKAGLEHWLAGRTIVVQALAAGPDRWDRLPALAALANPEAAGADRPPAASLNAALIEAGWARARPEAALHACFASLLEAEARARAAGLGLWADPHYAIVGAEDVTGLAQRSGGMAVVDGRVRLRTGRAGLIVMLGPGTSGLVAIVSRRVEKSLAKAGVDLQKLVGTAVRIRGFLDDRFGPRIDLVDADQIVPIESGRAVPPSGVGEPDRNH